MSSVPLAEVVRSGVVEAIHLGSIAVVTADGTVLASVGDVDRITFARSSMKPLQAAVSHELAGVELEDREVAVMCASHNGEAVHLEAVRSLLERAGLGPDALRTPPARPLDLEAAATAPGPAPEFHNCSGKHAGMLLACVRRSFDPATYPDPGHPLQQAVLAAVREAAGRDPEAIGVDGCGVPVHALPLRALARIYAVLAAGGLAGAERATGAMRAEPYLVAGRDRVCTAVMEQGNVIVKVGAEGLICAGLPARGIGVAIKVDDGAGRGLDPALVHVLLALQALTSDAGLERFARPPVLGGGHPVGELRPVFDLAL